MKIKEICEKTGLTDRTVRFYIEEGLISPSYTENYLGRKSFNFSEVDLQRLRNIATLRAFGFSVDEIKEITKDTSGNQRIVEEVRKRAEKSLDESNRRVNSLSRIDLSGELTLSDLAQKLTKSNIINDGEDHRAGSKKRVLSFLGSCVVFLSVWLPIVLSIVIFIFRISTVDSPIIHPEFLIFTLLCFLPSAFAVLLFKRITASRKIFRTIFVSLCALCIPLGIVFSVRSVTTCDHSYLEYRTLADATCTSEGEIVEKCEICGDILTKKTEMIPHNAVVVEGIDPTCGTDGITDASYCSICSRVLTEQMVIPATGNHTPVVDPARSPDCENVGLTEGSHCLTCGEILVEQISSPALGHTYVEQVVDSTCKIGGHTIHTCACGSTYIDNYKQPTLYHSFAKESDYSDRGKCTVCGLKVVQYGNADGTAIGGSDAVKFYLTGTDISSFGKTLVIYGSGDMPDYDIDNPPWNYFASQIKTIIIDEGITSIGYNAFSHRDYSNTGKLVIRSKHLKNINIKKYFAGISTVLCEIVFDY